MKGNYIFVKCDNSINPNKSIVLIDTFIISNFVSKDRYYTDLWENLSEEQKHITYFVPTFIGISLFKLPKVIDKITSSDRKHIFK